MIEKTIVGIAQTLALAGEIKIVSIPFVSFSTILPQRHRDNNVFSFQ